MVLGAHDVIGVLVSGAQKTIKVMVSGAHDVTGGLVSGARYYAIRST